MTAEYVLIDFSDNAPKNKTLSVEGKFFKISFFTNRAAYSASLLYIDRTDELQQIIMNLRGQRYYFKNKIVLLQIENKGPEFFYPLVIFGFGSEGKNKIMFTYDDKNFCLEFCD